MRRKLPVGGRLGIRRARSAVCSLSEGDSISNSALLLYAPAPQIGVCFCIDGEDENAASSCGQYLPLEKLGKILAHLICDRVHDGLSLPHSLPDVGKQQMRRRYRGKNDELPAPDLPDGDLQMVAGQPGEGISGGSLLDMGITDDQLGEEGVALPVSM